MVLLSGEPGIGKSRSVQSMLEHLSDEPHLVMRYQCSPYYDNTAFYPITEQFAAAADFSRADTPEHKLDKLEAHLEQAGLIVAEVAPLFAAALSIPTGDRYAPLDMSPEQQKDRTISDHRNDPGHPHFDGLYPPSGICLALGSEQPHHHLKFEPVEPVAECGIGRGADGRQETPP